MMPIVYRLSAAITVLDGFPDSQDFIKGKADGAILRHLGRRLHYLLEV
jgi:hypothetical protein